MAATLSYIGLFYAYLFDRFILKYEFTWLQYLGLAIIVSLNILNITCENQREKKKKMLEKSN